MSKSVNGKEEPHPPLREILKEGERFVESNGKLISDTPL